jgi:hypothetical protein
VPELCLVSTNKDFVCLSTKKESFIYHLTPETLQFKPFMKIDTRVRVFEVQENRMICDETVYVKTENNPAKILQTLPKESYIHSMLAVGSDILLIGYQNNIKLA